MSSPSTDGRGDPAEEAFLDELEGKSSAARGLAYLARGGPGYLQSAMTLGGGTAMSSIYAGRMFGYDLLWVAPAGMLIGVLMLSVLARLTLGREERPYELMRKEGGPVFAYVWAIGALVASIIWHFPQYGLAGAAIEDASEVAGMKVSAAVGAWPVLGVALVMSFLYGRTPRLVRIYETVVKVLVIGVIVAFGAVVAATAGSTDWAAVLSGFIPSLPAPRGGVDSWTLAASGLAAAVGINMVFLYPYSLRQRGWGGRHGGMARFDLFAGMLVPYTIAASLVVIATANAIPWELGDSVEKMKPVEAAEAFSGLLGKDGGRLVFDIGLIGMALSTIALHMVCSGFVVAEFFGKDSKSWAYRIGTLLPVPGVLGPLVWKDLLWLVIPTNIVCGLFLPMTYIGLILWSSRRTERQSPSRPTTRLAMAAVTLFLSAMLAREIVRLVS